MLVQLSYSRFSHFRVQFDVDVDTHKLHVVQRLHSWSCGRVFRPHNEESTTVKSLGLTGFG